MQGQADPSHLELLFIYVVRMGKEAEVDTICI